VLPSSALFTVDSLPLHETFFLILPEGATVQEAMAAASKAYTTDDGRTSVKQVSTLKTFFSSPAKRPNKLDRLPVASFILASLFFSSDMDWNNYIWQVYSV
jgi:hypothetical protein